MKKSDMWTVLRIVAPTLTLTVALAGAVGADDEVPAQDCAAIAAPDERLACYDAAAETGGEEIAATPGDDFGLADSKVETDGESLTGRVSGVWQDAYRKLIIQLDNGQIWRQTETKRYDAVVGDIVTIRRGALGSYKLYVDGEQGWIRVRREE